MPSISLPLASFLYNVSSVILVAGAVAVLLGTIGTVWTGSVKERYGDDRIAANEAETARANESAAKANEKAATLSNDAAQAKLEQERLKSLVMWREISKDNVYNMVQRLAYEPGGSVTIGYNGNDPEALSLASQFERVFQEANKQNGKEIWKLEYQPRIDTSRILFGIYVPGPDNEATISVRAAAMRSGFEVKNEAVPPATLNLPGIAIGPQEIETDVFLFVGSKDPNFAR